MCLEMEKNGTVPKATEAVVYCGNDILKKEHFEDICSLKCLAFAGNSHKIEKDLYKTLLANDVNITVCNGAVLTLVGTDGAALSSVSVAHKTEPEKQQNCAVTGKIDLSVHIK